MDLDTDRLFHPPLRDHEASVLENAVRLAVDSVINVLVSVNGARSREYRRVVEDRDREIRRLEGRLAALERELRLLRRRGCSCGLYEARSSEGGRPAAGDRGGCGDPEGGYRGASDPESCDPARCDPGCGDPEAAAGQQECEMRISLGLFGGPPSSLVSPHSLESTLPPSPGRPVLDQSSEASVGAELCGGVVKEEACDLDAVLIKWEMSEERTAGGRRRGGEEDEEEEEGEEPRSPSPAEKTGALGSSPRRRLGEKLHPDLGGAQFSEGESLRNRKRSVPMSQLPEEAQRIKRAAWRAASRRYYARKVARQQANPPPPAAAAHFPRLTNCPFSVPPPPDAWAAAHGRHYAQGGAAAVAAFGLPPGGGDGGGTPGDAQDAGDIMCS